MVQDILSLGNLSFMISFTYRTSQSLFELNKTKWFNDKWSYVAIVPKVLIVWVCYCNAIECETFNIIQYIIASDWQGMCRESGCERYGVHPWEIYGGVERTWSLMWSDNFLLAKHLKELIKGCLLGKKRYTTNTD